MPSSREQNSNTLSRKARERNARQQEIMVAARELFTLKGFHNTTLEEIASHAGFGKGTIYNYFSSKEELFYGIIDRLAEDTFTVAQAAVRASGGNAREQLAAYADAMISHARENAHLFNLIMRETSYLNSEKYESKIAEIHKRTQKIWVTLARPITREIRAGTIGPSEPLWLAAMFDGMVRIYCMMKFGAIQQWPPERSGAENPGAMIVSIFFDGVTRRKRKV
jgi:AcrR family transcriptional regulator